jgi:hypothetical protein
VKGRVKARFTPPARAQVQKRVREKTIASVEATPAVASLHDEAERREHEQRVQREQRERVWALVTETDDARDETFDVQRAIHSF